MFRKQKLELSQSLSSELAQARDVLLDAPKILKRKVRRVAGLGDSDPYALCLYTLAAGHRFSWTPADWQAVLDRLDTCELTVGEWIDGLT